MRLFHVFAIAILWAASVQSFCYGQQFGAWPPSYETIQFSEFATQETASEHGPAGIELYVNPDEKRTDTETDGRLPDNKRETDKGPKKDPRIADKASYPSLYRPGRRAVIIIFGFPTCKFCVAQALVIPKNYDLLKVNRSDSDASGKGKPTWRDLMKQWEVDKKVGDKLAPIYPTTVLVENGLPVKVWHAYKPWRELEPHVQKAKIADDEKDDRQVKPDETDRDRRKRRNFIDWFFNNSRKRGNKASNYRPRYGRWAK
jgi:hypothetical protein